MHPPEAIAKQRYVQSNGFLGEKYADYWLWNYEYIFLN